MLQFLLEMSYRIYYHRGYGDSSSANISGRLTCRNTTSGDSFLTNVATVTTRLSNSPESSPSRFHVISFRLRRRPANLSLPSKVGNARDGGLSLK